MSMRRKSADAVETEHTEYSQVGTRYGLTYLLLIINMNYLIIDIDIGRMAMQVVGSRGREEER